MLVPGYNSLQGGSYLQLLQNASEAGLAPTGVAGILHRVNDAIRSDDPRLKELVLASRLHSGDFVLSYHGKIKIIPHSEASRIIELCHGLNSGALTPDIRDFLGYEGPEFDRRDLELAGINTRLLKIKAKSQPFLVALAHDRSFLSDVVDAVFEEVYRRYGIYEAMGVSLPEERAYPIMLPLVVEPISEGLGVNGKGKFDEPAIILPIDADGTPSLPQLDTVMRLLREQPQATEEPSLEEIISV